MANSEIQDVEQQIFELTVKLNKLRKSNSGDGVRNYSCRLKVLFRPINCLHAVVHIELPVDVMEMGAEGVDADKKLGGDLFARCTADQMGEDFLLAGGECGRDYLRTRVVWWGADACQDHVGRHPSGEPDFTTQNGPSSSAEVLQQITEV